MASAQHARLPLVSEHGKVVYWRLDYLCSPITRDTCFKSCPVTGKERGWYRNGIVQSAAIVVCDPHGFM